MGVSAETLQGKTAMQVVSQIKVGWMARVKEVIDYCYNDGMFVILNSHHDLDDDYYVPSSLFQVQNGIYMRSIWSQISEVFKDYDQHLIFETLNEPRAVGSENEWEFDVGKRA